MPTISTKPYEGSKQFAFVLKAEILSCSFGKVCHIAQSLSPLLPDDLVLAFTSNTRR